MCFEERFAVAPHQLPIAMKFCLSLNSLSFVFTFWSSERTTANLQGLSSSKTKSLVAVSNEHRNHFFLAYCEMVYHLISSLF